jgi:hypothetical protein
MKHRLSNNSGLSIIATVMLMMILALFAAIGVSLVTTGSNVAVQEERGLEAFYIADGGLQYAAKTNLFPYFTVASIASPKPLGEGSFYTTVPTLSLGITAATTGPITVSSTDGFTTTNNPLDATPDQYWIMICDTSATGNPTPPLLATTTTCEKISCTGKTSTTFTTCTRGRDYSVGAAHLAGAVVLTYSWNTGIGTTLNRALARNRRCTSNNTRICVTSTANFTNTNKGFIRIVNAAEGSREDIFYDGVDTTGGAICGVCPGVCLGTNSCTRLAYSDTGNDNDGNYNDDSLNGIAQGNGTQVYLSEISGLATSTGVVPGAILTGNIKRVVQGKIMPLQ